MANELPDYPEKIWDGLSQNEQRESRLDDIEPNPEDWAKMVSELIAIQEHVGTGPIVPVVDEPVVVFNLKKDKKFEVILEGNRTLKVVNEKKGNIFMVRLIQDSVGSRTVTWFTTISWPGGVEPILSTAPNAVDAFVFLVIDKGIFEGFTAGQDL